MRSAFHWADFDADGQQDAFVVAPNSEGRLLRSTEGGGLVDVTVSAGLTNTATVRFGVWEDFDGDGFLDLFVGTHSGPSLLYRGLKGGIFEEVAESAGLTHVGSDMHAAFVDYDTDGRPDLHVNVQGRELLYHNEGQGTFRSVELELPTISPGTTSTPSKEHQTGVPKDAGDMLETTPVQPQTEDEATRAASRGGLERPRSTREDRPTQFRPASSTVDALESPHCAKALQDLDGGCLFASTTPALGRLYPITSDLYVDAVTGWVGVGTTSPGARLDVAGLAQFGSTLLPVAARGESQNGPTRGFLGVQGVSDFDGVTTADWSGQEIGIAGISVGASATDNYGVKGHSNGAGVRGESSADPTGTYGELGASGGIGVRAAGSTLAGDFTGDVDVTGVLEVDGSTASIDVFNSAGSRTTEIRGDLGGAGYMRLFNDSAAGRVFLDGGSVDSGGAIALAASDGSSTMDLDGNGLSDGGQITLRNDTSETTVNIFGDSSNAGHLELWDRDGSNFLKTFEFRARDLSSSGPQMALRSAPGTTTFQLDGSIVSAASLIMREDDGSNALSFQGDFLALYDSAGSVSVTYDRQTGAKSAVVETTSGRRRLFAMESPEIWFEDFGSGRLVGGGAHVELDSIFLETVTVDAQNPLRVFLTPTSPMGNWWVEARSTHFIVHAESGAPNATFTWRVVAKRKHCESMRLTPFDQILQEGREGRPGSSQELPRDGVEPTEVER